MVDLDVPIWLWFAFTGVVLGLLALDLGVFHRKAHAVSIREAALWSATWVTLSLAFCAGIFVFGGSDAGVAFLTGYLIEYSLSVDNIFVFVLIFSYFAVPGAYQHRVLFWGVVGALVMRFVFIIAGAALLEQFDWLIYIFGAVLLASALRMATSRKEEGASLDRNFAVRLVRRLLPVTDDYRGQRFFVRENARLAATPLLLVLVVVESTDLIFAVDSIPAIFAVTRETFLIYTSNVCAILGLRSLYFLLAGVSDRFHYLKPALALVLAWVGTKMLIADIYHVPIVLSLGFIVVVLSVAVAASLLFPRGAREEAVIGPHGHRPSHQA
jgi:tellurite resistance protein TerC